MGCGVGLIVGMVSFETESYFWFSPVVFVVFAIAYPKAHDATSAVANNFIFFMIF
jgi:hypothetical protein